MPSGNSLLTTSTEDQTTEVVKASEELTNTLETETTTSETVTTPFSITTTETVSISKDKDSITSIPDETQVTKATENLLSITDPSTVAGEH